MTGDQIAWMIGAVLIATVVVIAVMRFPRLGLRFKGALGEAELRGDATKADERSTPPMTATPNVSTIVAGDVQASTIITSAGSVGNVPTKVSIEPPRSKSD